MVGGAVIWSRGDEGRGGHWGGWEEQHPSLPPPQRAPSARVSHPIWICNGMIASSRNLAAFSQNAIARKSHGILWGPRSKEPMDETIPISQQPNSKKARGLSLYLTSTLSSKHSSGVASVTAQWKGQEVSDTGWKEWKNTNFCLKERRKQKTSTYRRSSNWYLLNKSACYTMLSLSAVNH